jgi:hypothetical protein
LHARAAAVLEQHFPEFVERQRQLLAHLTAAGETEWAVDRWLKAGRYAAQGLSHLLLDALPIRLFRRLTVRR